MLRRIKHQGLVGLLAGLLGWAAIGAVAAGEAERVPQLIRDLGSSQYGQREKAMKQLDALGPVALAALQEATRNDDLEVRRRSQALVERIEKRVQSAKLLEPRRVHLVYKNTPLGQAVADFARKTGYPIQLQRGVHLPADRTITLDTGAVSFWEALDQFCRQAGLMEQSRLPMRRHPIPANADRLRQEQEVLILLRQQALMGVNNSYTVPTRMSLTLVAGKTPALPTDRAGAVRIQALNPELCVIPVAKSSEQVQVVLEVVPEPKLNWKKVVELQITKAVDDRGQALEQVVQTEKPLVEHDLDLRVQAMLNGQNGNVELLSRGLRQIPVSLKVNQNRPKKIRELQGTVSALVLTPPEVLVTIDDIVKAAGKTVRAKDGSAIKVVEARQDTRGQLRLQFELPGWFGRTSNEPVIIRRGRMGRMVVNTSGDMGRSLGAMTWAVQDARGKRLSLVRMEPRVNQRDNELVQENYLTFSLRGQEGPFQFVLTGQRLVILDVPFTLKDIPVP